MTKTILILAANPRQDLDLRREVHILKSVIQRSQAQDEFEIKIDSGINADKIQKLFLEHKPHIVHFCGHGAGRDGLVFEDNLVSNEALSDLFKHFDNQVECVLLNACYADVQATEISHHINYVIGMKQAIRDDSAIVFARGFYEALGYQQSIEDAYNLGCNAIKLQIDKINDSSPVISASERNAYVPKKASKSRAEYLKPQLKIKSPLTQFDDENKSKPGNNLPDLTKLVEYEIELSEYEKEIEKDFDIGRFYPNRKLTRQEYRYKKVLLSKVKQFWIEGVLKKSLFNQVLFEQEIIERPDAVNHPFSGFEEFAIESDQSFEFIHASDIFEGMGAGRTLLILGEPGTGKTVSLLKLAERLIKRTEQDLSLPIPVVFNLSSWAIKRQNIADWLVEELAIPSQYNVSKALGKQWIDQEDLILLLDGLDEVKAEYRNDCVRALNQFLEQHGITETVVCSRVKDYQALSERLQLLNAICIQPLSSEYISWYLDDIGKPLVGLKQLLQRDKELEEFARTPLIFSVMTIAYKDYSLEALLQEMSVKEKRYERLFDNYIERMYSHRKLAKKYSKEKLKYWLTYLSKEIKYSSLSIFFIEKMQISWLINCREKWTYRISFGMLAALIVGIIFGTFGELKIGLTFGLIGGLIGGLLNEIKTVESFRLSFADKSWKKFFKNMSDGLIRGLTFGLIGGLIGALEVGLISGLIAGLVFGLISGMIIGLIDALKADIQTRTKPNQGICESAKNSAVITSSVLLIFVLVLQTLSYIFSQAQSTRLVVCLLAASVCGCGSKSGGQASMQHFTLRLILYLNGYIPWNYSRFLDYATERLFMQKVGGGYIFIHRMLMEHFANMKLD